MRKIIFLLCCTCTVLVTAAQTITGPGSGLNRPTTATATLALGGTVTTPTTLDFTTSTTANFLIKKATANYFFVGNDGKIGIGSATPTSLFSLGSAVGNSKLALWDNGTTLRSGFGWQTAQFRLHLSATTDKFSFLGTEAATTDLMTILGTGNVGIGIAPTAVMQLKSGTATANTAPLKFTSGVPTTTPEIGALHFNNGLLILDSSNTVRDTLATRSWARKNIVAGSGGGAVTQVFGRTGAVVAAANDYTFAQIAAKPTTLAGYGITDAAALSHTHAIDVLSNVTIATPVNNQVLTYNSTSAKWENKAAIAGGSGWGLTGNAATAPVTNFIGTTDAQRLVFKTNALERATILSNGYVGIGTSTPATALHVAGDFTLGGRAIFDNGFGFPNISVYQFNAPANTISAGFGSGSNIGLTANDYSTALRFNGSGIGYGDFQYYPNGGGNGNQGNFRFSITGSAVNTTPTGKLGVGEIYSAGNVGIGTTTPTEKLDVTGNIKFSGALMPNNAAGIAGQVLTSAGAGLPPLWKASVSQTPWSSDIDGGQYGIANIKKLNVYKAATAAENLLLYSEVLSNATWQNSNIAITDNQATDLAGNNTMELIFANFAGSNDIHQTVAVTPGTTYYFSWDVKRGTATDVYYGVYDLSHFNYIINPTSYYSSTSATVQRVQFSFTAPGGCNSVRLLPYNSTPVTGNVYIGRVQLATSPSAAYTTTTTTPLLPVGGTIYALATDDFGNVGMGTTTPTQKLDVNGNIYTNGKIMIGTSGLATGTHSLAVNGSAIFTKAVVRLTGTWPDYVFKPSYKLPALNELEDYLLKNQHLPDVPSASDIEKNGINIGDNQAILLKKVEELTLYMIDLNKKVEALAKENEELKKKVNNPNK